MKQRTFEVLYKDKDGNNRNQLQVAVSAAAALAQAISADILFDVFKRVYVC